MARRSREEILADFDKSGLGGYQLFDDRENGIVYVLDPKSVDEKELEDAIKAKDYEYFKKNYTFHAPSPKDVFDKEKWVFRE